MKKICFWMSILSLFFLTGGLYAEEGEDSGLELKKDEVKVEDNDIQPEQKAVTDKEVTKQEVKVEEKDQQVQPDSKDVKTDKGATNEEAKVQTEQPSGEVEEEETEEVEEPVVYKKEGELGLGFKFAWGLTKVSSELDYYGMKSETSSTGGATVKSTSYTIDSDTYLGIANFLLSVSYRPVDLPLDVGISFMMERYKESYPLFRKGDVASVNDPDPSRESSEFADDSYIVKTKMQKISLDISYSFPEFVVVPYVAINIYPWYNTKIKGFQYKGDSWLNNKGQISADSDIGYGCTIGVSYNVWNKLATFLQFSFEKNVSKVKLSDVFEEEGSSTTKKARFELEHRISKIMLGTSYSI